MSLLAWRPKLSFTGKTNKNTKLIPQRIHLAAILCPYLHRFTLSTMPRWSACIHSTIYLLAKCFKWSQEHFFLTGSSGHRSGVEWFCCCYYHLRQLVTVTPHTLVRLNGWWKGAHGFFFFKKKYKRNNQEESERSNSLGSCHPPLVGSVLIILGGGRWFSTLLLLNLSMWSRQCTSFVNYWRNEICSSLRGRRTQRPMKSIGIDWTCSREAGGLWVTHRPTHDVGAWAGLKKKHVKKKKKTLTKSQPHGG